MFAKKEMTALKSKKFVCKMNKFQLVSDKADHLSDFSQTKLCYNFLVSSGALKKSYGFAQLALPESEEFGAEEKTFDSGAEKILAIWPFVCYDTLSGKDKYYVIYVDENKKLKFFNVFTDKYIYDTDITFSSLPNAAPFRINDGMDTIIFSSKDDQTVGINGSGHQVFDDIPKFVSACWHGPYLFLATIGDNNQLKYSENTIDMWNETVVKTVDLPDTRGGLTKLISAGDILYVFREFGITSVTLYSTQSEVATSNIHSCSSFIFPRSIAREGDRIFFFTSDGFYQLQGENVKKLDFFGFERIRFGSGENCCGTCFGGKYYFACHYDFSEEDSLENNALLVYDLENGDVEVVKGVDICDLFVLLTPSVRKLCATLHGERAGVICQLTEDGRFFGEPLQKFWQGGWSDFGKDGLKRIESLCVQKGEEFSLSIESDLDSAQIKVTPSTKCQRIRTNVIGHVFRLSLSTFSEHEICCPKLGVRSIE